MFGFYHKGNLGDNLFVDAFEKLFPNYNFTFVDQITFNDLQNKDAVFIGGGSLLGEELKVSDQETWDLLCRQKIFYIGVGGEIELYNIDQSHLQLMTIAKLIAIRTPLDLNKIKEINLNTIVIPDLVYCLEPTFSDYKIHNSLLVIPNISVVPTWNEPHWKHAAWDYFKTEFAQFLDEIIVQERVTLSFFPLCTNFELDDQLASAEIVARMSQRNNKYFLEKQTTLHSATQLISRYETVITQRYHGIVLSEISNVPYISIHHHNKLKNTQGPNISYYGLTKDKLRGQFNFVRNTKVNNVLPIDLNTFDILKELVENALCES